MDIQSLHMQNNAYRDIIADLKAKINEYDKKINVNEMLIGGQLEDMEQALRGDCTLCLGECKGMDHVLD